MAQHGRSARETQEELELYRDKLARKKRRLEMVRGFRKPLLFLASGLIIGVVAFALLSDWTEEWGGRAEPLPDIEATVQSRVEKAVGVVNDSESVLAEDVFQDIFQNATQVDRFSIDDIKNCQVESTYDVKLGDVVTVEVAFARREDSKSSRPRLQPHVFSIRDTSDDGVLGNVADLYRIQFDLPFRTIGNPWNEMNAGPYVIAVYRGKSTMVNDPSRENTAIGDWIATSTVDNFGSLVPGTYKVSFVEDTNISSLCNQLQEDIDVTNLIPDSVLIAWYVN